MTAPVIEFDAESKFASRRRDAIATGRTSRPDSGLSNSGGGDVTSVLAVMASCLAWSFLVCTLWMSTNVLIKSSGRGFCYYYYYFY